MQLSEQEPTDQWNWLSFSGATPRSPTSSELLQNLNIAEDKEKLALNFNEIGQ